MGSARPPSGAVAAYRRPPIAPGSISSDATFATLGLRDNDFVEWRFVHRGYIPFPRLTQCGRQSESSLRRIAREMI